MGELFRASLDGLSEVIYPGICAKNSEIGFEEKISVESIDETALLIDFLSEALSLSHQCGVVFCSAEFESVSETNVTASLAGIKVDEFREDVKAVTYHEADVKRNADGDLETYIVLDI